MFLHRINFHITSYCLCFLGSMSISISALNCGAVGVVDHGSAEELHLISVNNLHQQAQLNEDISQLSKQIPHPHILLTPNLLQDLRQRVVNDGFSKYQFNKIKGNSNVILQTPNVSWQAFQQGTINARQILDSLTNVALTYLIDQDPNKLMRVHQDVLAVTQFPNWSNSPNDTAFLSVAQIAYGMSAVYDWLYDTWTPAERQTIRHALIQHALQPGKHAFSTHVYWTDGVTNWSLICNGALVVASLAIANDENDDWATHYAKDVFHKALTGFKRALNNYNPDGGWGEGPLYWSFGSWFAAFTIDAVQTSLNSDLGMSSMSGLKHTGDFRMHSISPTNLAFNYADSAEEALSGYMSFWVARQYGNPAYYAFESTIHHTGGVFALLWYDPTIAKKTVTMPSSNAYFKGPGVETAFMRTAWNDPNALYVAFKGGDNPNVGSGTHYHMDLGSFVLDALGQRWLIDLGADDYSIRGYFADKYKFYRARTEGHNTLGISTTAQASLHIKNQALGAHAPLIAFSAVPQKTLAVVDLTAAYPETQKVLRGVQVLNQNVVVVQDEITAVAPVEVISMFHTRAQITIGALGQTATFVQNGQSLIANIVAPQGAYFDTITANPVPLNLANNPAENANVGVTNLVVRLNGMVTHAQIVVQFAPGTTTAPTAPAITPLSSWIKLGKITR